MKKNRNIDRVWKTMVALVMDTRGDWRRKAVDLTGIPFSRVRALTRLAKSPLSLSELADAMTCDAPAATVIVNDLEKRGLVRRRSDEVDRRTKIVSLTAAGKRVASTIDGIRDVVPEPLASLSHEDVALLSRIFERSQ